MYTPTLAWKLAAFMARTYQFHTACSRNASGSVSAHHPTSTLMRLRNQARQALTRTGPNPLAVKADSPMCTCVHSRDRTNRVYSCLQD